ncbi:hypothetical protein T265_08372 [Opisthorchis viverrini]|uniref:SCP domain-containing protein n=1 Tax=Opisthorchis viverrini TaxID=6198 RepID=A0A074ZDW4_OPIVI|nr:hypothetical protein T265_08372 [Opisthorchis viverrini]KER23827.1 hypothetical protein T265_08372 [Opisthorchis viverrini]
MTQMLCSLLLVLIVPIVLECSRQNKANNYGLGPISNLSMLEKHNLVRRMIAQGEIKGQPQAESMPELHWSVRLEEEAKHWAWHCVDMKEPDSESGETRGYSEEEDYDIFVDWFGEHKNYTYGLFPKSRKRSITRYTQAQSPGFCQPYVPLETKLHEISGYTLICKLIWFLERLTWNPAESLVCEYLACVNITNERFKWLVWAETEEVGCSTYFCYSFQTADGSYLQDVDYTAQSPGFCQPYVPLETKLHEISGYTLICKLIWFLERLTWNPAESLVCEYLACVNITNERFNWVPDPDPEHIKEVCLLCGSLPLQIDNAASSQKLPPLVWAETEEVGCSTYFCYSFQTADGSYLQDVDYTVCKYSPALWVCSPSLAVGLQTFHHQSSGLSDPFDPALTMSPRFVTKRLQSNCQPRQAHQQSSSAPELPTYHIPGGLLGGCGGCWTGYRPRGWAKAAQDAARRSPRKMDGAAAIETFAAEFDTQADRQEAMRRFKTAKISPISDTTRVAVVGSRFAGTGSRSRHQLLSDQFVGGVQPLLGTQLRLAKATGQLCLEELTHLAGKVAEGPLTMFQPQEDRDVDELQTRVNRLAERLAAMKTESRRCTRTSRSCKCGRPGHWKNQCPRTLVINILITSLFPGLGPSLSRRENQAEYRPCALPVRVVGGYRLKIDGSPMHSMRLGDNFVQHARLA